MIAFRRRERGEAEREPAAIILSEAKDLMRKIAEIAKIAGIDDLVPSTHQSSILAITNPGTV